MSSVEWGLTIANRNSLWYSWLISLNVLEFTCIDLYLGKWMLPMILTMHLQLDILLTHFHTLYPFTSHIYYGNCQNKFGYGLVSACMM
jgi:hypothetical protein